MALVVNQTPQLYHPGYNTAAFQATTTNAAQPNHTFTVVIADADSGDTETYQIPADGINDSMVFDALPFIRRYLTHYMPLNGLAGWKKCVNAIKQIVVNVGETYGSTPVYFPGSDYSFYVWNAYVDYIPFANYTMAQYVYDGATTNYKYFAGVTNDFTFTGRSNWLYVLNDFTGSSIKAIQVVTYNSAGSVVGNTLLPNTFASPVDYTESYVCIDVGHKGLSSFLTPSAAASGTVPILTSSVASYKIYDVETLAFSGESCTLPAGVLTINFSVDPGLSVSQTFPYFMNDPSITGATPSGTLTITAVNGGGSYTTNVSCTISTGSVAGGYIVTSARNLIKTVTLGCEAKYRVMTVHYLALNGAYQTCNFDMISDTTENKTGQTYRLNPNVNSGTSYGYTANDPVEYDISIERQKELVLRTNWLSLEQQTKYEECFDSSRWYLDGHPDTVRSIPIRAIGQTYKSPPRYKDKLVFYEQKFVYAHQNSRQDA